MRQVVVRDDIDEAVEGVELGVVVGSHAVRRMNPPHVGVR